MAEQKKLERVYIIPLRKVYQKAPHYKRAKKAASAIREFVERHMKAKETKIGGYLNMKIWEHGIKNPPHKVKVNCIKDEKGIVTVELFDAPKVPTKEEKKKKETIPKKKPTKAENEKLKEKSQKELAAREIQKEEIKELKKERPKEHKPKEEAIPKDDSMRKKEFLTPKG